MQQVLFLKGVLDLIASDMHTRRSRLLAQSDQVSRRPLVHSVQLAEGIGTPQVTELRNCVVERGRPGTNSSEGRHTAPLYTGSGPRHRLTSGRSAGYAGVATWHMRIVLDHRVTVMTWHIVSVATYWCHAEPSQAYRTDYIYIDAPTLAQISGQRRSAQFSRYFCRLCWIKTYNRYDYHMLGIINVKHNVCTSSCLYVHPCVWREALVAYNATRASVMSQTCSLAIDRTSLIIDIQVGKSFSEMIMSVCGPHVRHRPLSRTHIRHTPLHKMQEGAHAHRGWAQLSLAPVHTLEDAHAQKAGAQLSLAPVHIPRGRACAEGRRAAQSRASAHDTSESLFIRNVVFA